MNKSGSELLPSFKQLLQFESVARKDGSGIDNNFLIGEWILSSVFKNDGEDTLSSFVLRTINASLTIEKNIKQVGIMPLTLSNAVNFVGLKLLLTGPAEFKGNQPLLNFYFDKIKITLGSITIFDRTLSIPLESKRPFFALIAMEKNRIWFSARGRGGGIAIWIRK